jgi:predicted transposase YbfD/YdcC
MVTAWNCDQRLVLTRIATAAKFNEVTAISMLLETLSLKGMIDTVDALNCQREITQRIGDQDSD